MKVLTTILIILISINLVAQKKQTRTYLELDSIDKVKVDSIVLSQIPYSKEKAILDIQNNIIQIIQLSPGGSPAFNNEEISLIEQRFGFYFIYDFLKYPRKHLERAEQDYNSIVYEYLDSINNIDSKNEIRSELKRLFNERQFTSQKTDKELHKTIQKKLRGENKEIKIEVLNADKLYRDRKFNDALNEYESIRLKITTCKTKDYITNSMYHCFMNLQLYEKADSLKNMNNQVNKIFK